VSGKLNWERAAARQRADAVPRGEREPVRNYDDANRNRKRRAKAKERVIAKAKRAAAANRPTIKVVSKQDRPPGAQVISSSRKPKRAPV